MCMEQVEHFNKTLLNIFHNSIRNKTFLCDDKDPPSMNENIKTLINMKNWLFQCQRMWDNLDYACLKSIMQDTSNTVNPSKLKYNECLAFKLNDPKSASKNLLESTKNIC